MKKTVLLLLALNSLVFAEENQLKKTQAKKISIPAAIDTATGIQLPKGKLALNLKTVYFENNVLLKSNEKISNPTNKQMTAFTNNVIVRYGFSNSLNFRALLPVISKEMNLTNTGVQETSLDNFGIGDAKLFLGYSLKSPQKGDSYGLTAEIGASIPTGDSDKNFKIYTAKGASISKEPLGMQLGDGSFDPIVQLSYTKLFPTSRIDVSSNYIFNTEGDNNYKSGNESTINVAYVKKTPYNLSLQVEMNAQFIDKSEKSGIKDDNTGGSIIYVMPGIHTNLNSKFSLSGGIQVPIYKDLNGTQLTNDCRVITRVAYSIK